jgi:hypothetical protein
MRNVEPGDVCAQHPGANENLRKNFAQKYLVSVWPSGKAFYLIVFNLLLRKF